VHRREEVHSQHSLGSRRCFGDSRNGNRARVRREYRRFPELGFDFAKHFVLDRQVLEHGLDHEVDVAETGIIDRSAEQRHHVRVLHAGYLLFRESFLEDFAHG
jgi:hypothetical protein